MAHAHTVVVAFLKPPTSAFFGCLLRLLGHAAFLNAPHQYPVPENHWVVVACVGGAGQVVYATANLRDHSLFFFAIIRLGKLFLYVCVWAT